LAFSGGVDSFAALALLPEKTIPVFCHRTRPADVPKGLYRADAALLACKELSTTHDVHVFDTDMEYVRDPVGFSVDWTNAAGAVLLADYYNFNSISFGMVLESAYFIGHPYYSNLNTRSIYSAWAPLFETVGIPISLPTAGLSEVVTSKIVTSKVSEWHPESCVRGSVRKPCMRCFKCFRKTILDARLSDSELPIKHFDIALESREVKRRLLETPIHHENVLSYSISGLKCGKNPILSAIRAKSLPILEYASGLSVLERHYPRSAELVPDFLWHDVAKKISIFAKPYTHADTELIETWETGSLTKLVPYQKAHEELLLHLENGLQ
jgi:hypothetical protein